MWKMQTGHPGLVGCDTYSVIHNELVVEMLLVLLGARASNQGSSCSSGNMLPVRESCLHLTG